MKNREENNDLPHYKDLSLHLDSQPYINLKPDRLH